MNAKRLVVCFVAVFLFMFLFEWLFHGILLQGLYAQSPGVWRPENEMMKIFHWLVLGQAVKALFFSVIFAIGFASRGVGEGFRFGVLLALLFVGESLISYTVQPLPVALIAYWSIGGIVEYGIAGVLAAAIYRPMKIEQPPAPAVATAS